MGIRRWVTLTGRSMKGHSGGNRHGSHSRRHSHPQDVRAWASSDIEGVCGNVICDS